MTIPAPRKLPFDPWFKDNPLVGSSYIEKELREGTFKVLSASQYYYHFSQSVVHKEIPAEPKKVQLFLEVLDKCAKAYPEIYKTNT